MKILITAGPTREHIDDVRFISNASSGRMGFAIAEAALERGHEVDLVAGPVTIAPPEGAHLTSVVSAQEMRDAVLERVGASDVLIMTAAVSDWRPKVRSGGKIDKGPEEFSLDLMRNPDILREATGASPDTPAVAFALEAKMDRNSALEKMRSKGADMVVLNTVASMGAGEAEFAVYSSSGGDPAASGRFTKKALAGALLDLIEREKSR